MNKIPSLSTAELQILKLFQTEENRNAEEIFSHLITTRNDTKLSFVNKNQAYTDGINIVVDPAMFHCFSDVQALELTEDFLCIPHSYSTDVWKALEIITHGQTLHESLHIMYTKFPSYLTDNACFNTEQKRFTIHCIENVIEDAFIDNASSTLYDKISLYLKFLHVINLTSNFPGEGSLRTNYKQTVSKTSIEQLEEYEKSLNALDKLPSATQLSEPPELKLFEFLEYITIYSCYSFIELSEPPQIIANYFEKAKVLIDKAVLCGKAKQRADYCLRIYEIIEELIPKGIKLPENKTLKILLGGSSKTHNGKANSNTQYENEPLEITITKKLFGTGLDKSEIPQSNSKSQPNSNSQLHGSVKLQCNQETIKIKPIIKNIDSSYYDCTDIHRGIKIQQVKPVPDKNLEYAYKSIIQKYEVSINTWNKKFTSIIKSEREVPDEQLFFGTKLNSHNFGDVKKRYWQKSVTETGLPDIAVMIMIDGSGSMSGSRQNSTIDSCVILHEVLKKQEIEHCVVDYRAIYQQDLLVHNILLGFNAKKNDCLNLLTFDPVEGTRDGLSMLWAEKYINQNSSAKNKLIIVISDGVPDHTGNKCKDYCNEIAIVDSTRCAKKIQQRGITIIGVALDDNGNDNEDYEYDVDDDDTDNNCFKTLQRIYTNSIECTDLQNLTGQLLTLIAKKIMY